MLFNWEPDKDGVSIEDFFKRWWTDWKRLLTLQRGIGDIGHAWINIWTEPRKYLPVSGHLYHFGHVVGILVSLLTLTIILLAVL